MIREGTDPLECYISEPTEEDTMPTTTRPGFRKPWTHGAKAYEEADTLEDLVAGLKQIGRAHV